MRHVILAAAAVLGMAVAPHLARAQTPVVEASAAWARATTSSARVGGVFLTLTATGAPDRVVSGSTPVAERVELHETLNEAGIMKMRPVEVLLVTPGEPVVLKPGAQHIMLMGLKKPLNRGDSFPLTITFAPYGVLFFSRLLIGPEVSTNIYELLP